MRIINDWLQLPEAYDSFFWQYMEYNINELAFHTHDGENGDKIPSSSVTHNFLNTFTPNLQDTNGLYYSTVTLPTGYLFDDTNISFFNDANERVFLDYQKIDDNTYRVYSAYNDKTYGVMYG